MNNKTNLIPASSGSNPIISESSSLSYLEDDALEAVITLFPNIHTVTRFSSFGFNSIEGHITA